MKCPHCSKNIDVRFIKAPDSAGAAPSEDTSDLGTLLGSVNQQSLDEESLTFYTQTKERFEQYGDRTRMSPKQMAWLRKLAAGDAGERW